MPYILTLLGFIFLLYVLSRLMRQLQSDKASRLFRYGFAVILGALAFLIGIRGNVAAGGILGFISFLSAQGGLWRFFGADSDISTGQAESEQARRAANRNLPMSRAEALDILGLRGAPTPQDVREAHHRLMLRIHPDQGGSDYLASKLNQAKDILLDK